MLMTKDCIKDCSVLNPHPASATVTLLFWARHNTPGVTG